MVPGFGLNASRRLDESIRIVAPEERVWPHPLRVERYRAAVGCVGMGRYHGQDRRLSATLNPSYGPFMAYRRTERVTARLAARHEAIIGAARALASESGMAAVQIVPVAERAGIAAGTVYRYFPSKDDLVAALVGATAEREIAVVRCAAAAAPGPLSGLAAAIMASATSTLRARRLAWAMMAAEPESGADAGRLAFRRSLAGEFEIL